jgi:putative membrane protein
LFFLPFHEIITRIFRVPKGWKSLTITLFIVLSMKEFFEIIEYSYTAVRNNNLTTTNYLGEQGDVFDSIKDVTLGFIGAIISMITISIKKVF